MRTELAFVACLTLLTTSGSLMAGSEREHLPWPYRPGNNHAFSAVALDTKAPPAGAYIPAWRMPAWMAGFPTPGGSNRYDLSWHEWLAPASAAALRDPIGGHVFSTEVDPAITVDLSGSSVQFHRRGLRYQGANEAWSLGLNYRRLKLAPDLELLIKERTERPMVLRVEWSLAFD